VLGARKIEKYSEGVLVKYWMPGFFRSNSCLEAAFALCFGSWRLTSSGFEFDLILFQILCSSVVPLDTVEILKGCERQFSDAIVECSS
jgi:hypothetical protein